MQRERLQATADSNERSTVAPTKVLILSKQLDGLGGVVNFVRSIIETRPSGVEYMHLSIGSRSGGLRNPWNWVFPAADSFRLWRRLARWKPDVVHLNPSLNLPSIIRDGLLILTLRVLGFPKRIVMFHGWEKHSLDNRLVRNFFLATFGKATRTIVLAREFKQDLIALGFDPSSIVVVSTMFHEEQFKAMPVRNPDPTTRVLFLSRFVPAKGVYLVLEAVQRLLAEGENICLLLAGDGPEKDRMMQWVQQNNIAEHVRFVGYVRGTRKAEIFSQADVYVLPSSTEGCPISLLEALAAGLPVVCSATGGIPDVVQDGRNGVLLENPTAESVAEGIRLYHRDRKLAQSTGKTNREYAWSTFEAGTVARRITHAYDI